MEAEVIEYVVLKTPYQQFSTGENQRFTLDVEVKAQCAGYIRSDDTFSRNLQEGSDDHPGTDHPIV